MQFRQNNGRKETTKGTKSTKVDFDQLSNRVIGCAIMGSPPPSTGTTRISIRITRRNGEMASNDSLSDSSVLFVSFMVPI